MALTLDQINFQAQKASWYIDYNWNNWNIGGDTVVYTGDGVDDLDRVIAVMQSNPNGIALIDTGTLTSSWQPCTLADVQGIRTAYIAYWGTVNEPGFPTGQPAIIETNGTENEPFVSS